MNAYRWHGNQHGSFISWLDDALKDLDMSFQVKPDILDPDAWMTIINVGYRSGNGLVSVKHGFTSKEDAKKYCEEYLASELTGLEG